MTIHNRASEDWEVQLRQSNTGWFLVLYLAGKHQDALDFIHKTRHEAYDQGYKDGLTQASADIEAIETLVEETIAAEKARILKAVTAMPYKGECQVFKQRVLAVIGANIPDASRVCPCRFEGNERCHHADCKICGPHTSKQ